MGAGRSSGNGYVCAGREGSVRQATRLGAVCTSRFQKSRREVRGIIFNTKGTKHTTGQTTELHGLFPSRSLCTLCLENRNSKLYFIAFTVRLFYTLKIALWQ